MSIHLNKTEQKISRELAKLKRKSGSHSPSFSTLKWLFPKLNIKLDCCFLSNPYATDLFLKFFDKDIIKGGKFRSLIEHYPSQNRAVSARVTRFFGVPYQYLFIGNGSTEIIQAIFHNFIGKKVLVPIPTFSPYLEFVKHSTAIHHQLEKINNYLLKPQKFLSDVHKHKPDAVVLINPNNPDGGYLKLSEVKDLLIGLKNIETVILDASFIDFAEKNPARTLRTLFKLVKTHPNLIVLKSLSKDLGIAGLRVGVAAMDPQRIDGLLANGYLWNISGLAEYVLDLQNDPHFRRQYEQSRRLIVKERDAFYRQLAKIKQIRVYPSKANFFLVELTDGTTAQDFMTRLLTTYGIYTRPCGDKVGLSGEFVRIASSRRAENDYVVNSIKKAFKNA